MKETTKVGMVIFSAPFLAMAIGLGQSYLMRQGSNPCSYTRVYRETAQKADTNDDGITSMPEWQAVYEKLGARPDRELTYEQMREYLRRR